MPLGDKDLSYLVDIFDCVEDVIAYTSDISIHDFEKEKMRRLAVERQLEVIGQAANRVTENGQNQLNQIPWSQMIGLRNKLAHDYGEILVKRIWDTKAYTYRDIDSHIWLVDSGIDTKKKKEHHYRR